jgi:hypothetical protein
MMGEVKISHEQEVLEFVRLQEPLWWNADRTKIVSKGDPDAAFAYGGISTRVPLEQAKADGLVKETKKKATAKK